MYSVGLGQKKIGRKNRKALFFSFKMAAQNGRSKWPLGTFSLTFVLFFKMAADNFVSIFLKKSEIDPF